jgi:hypothetical protein
VEDDIDERIKNIPIDFPFKLDTIVSVSTDVMVTYSRPVVGLAKWPNNGVGLVCGMPSAVQCP